MKKQTLALGLMAALGFSTTTVAAGAAQSIHVYKSPTCGCCEDWIDHLEDNGFEVEATNTNDMGRIKADAGLSEAPRATGLSVPGMPIGSPGMEMGDRKDHYKVILFNEAGQTRIFSQHN